MGSTFYWWEHRLYSWTAWVQIQALRFQLCDFRSLKKSDLIDYSVGVYLNKKTNEWVNKGEVLYTIYSNDEEKTSIAQKYCDEAYVINNEKSSRKNIIHKIIRSEYEEDDV